jgi:hypothetical protein
LSRVGLDGCDVLHISRSIPSNYGHALLWLGVLYMCIGLRKGHVGHHIILWGHGGGADEQVDRRGGTGGSSVHP